VQELTLKIIGKVDLQSNLI